jgi:oligopeptide/dipeptide ABC transporter ATP-binding protein
MSSPVLDIRDLRKHFPLDDGGLGFGRRRAVHAVDGVSFTLGRGETLGLVGESGCGKSTLGRLVLRLIEPSSGSVRVAGVELAGLSRRKLHAMRRQMQIIFQNPMGSLNPRMRVAEAVAEPLRAYGVGNRAARLAEARRLLTLVGLDPAQAGRFPHEFSGGQRQRIAIARAIALRPTLVVCDEAVSALDVSIQAQILNLLRDLQQEFGFAYLFISHDLSVIRHVSDRVAVMYLGQIVELAPADALFAAPRHPYTQALLSSVPVTAPDQRRSRPPLYGSVPSPIDLPAGCRFRDRCAQAMPRCAIAAPVLSGGLHAVACHLYD